MAVRTNHALAKLRAGGTIFGPTAAYASPDLAERRVAQGFRFVNYGLDHAIVLDGMRQIRSLIQGWTK